MSLDLDALPRILCRDRRPRTEPPTSICLHVPVSQEWAGAAEAVARYLANPPVTAGIHFAVDCDSIVMCADPRVETVPHCYRPSGWSVGIEIAGTVQDAEGWADEFSRATLARTAELVATLCREFGIPPVILSPLEVAGRARGVFDHGAATTACRFMGWPQDGHHDVGPEFPWDWFLAEAARLLCPEEDEMLQFPIRPVTSGPLAGRWVKIRPEEGGQKLRLWFAQWVGVPSSSVTPSLGTVVLDVAKALGKQALSGDVKIGAIPDGVLVSDADGDYAFTVTTP